MIIEAKRYRTQEQNRLNAIQRHQALVQEAQETRLSVTSSAARVDEKKHRGEIKRNGKFASTDWE